MCRDEKQKTKKKIKERAGEGKVAKKSNSVTEKQHYFKAYMYFN